MSHTDESEDSVIVLVRLVKNSDEGPTTMAAPLVFLGRQRVRLAEEAALRLYDADQVSTSFISTADADAARARWLKHLKTGQPAPLNCRSSLRWRLVVGER
jgi:hypothetical protein